MKLVKRRGIPILVFLSLFGNYSLGQSASKIELNDSTIYELEGSYMIFSKDSSNLLPSCLINNYHFNWENLADSNDYLKIEVLSPRKIKIGLYENGKFIKSKTVNGEIDDGCFSANPFFIHPFYLVLFGTAKYNFKLGKTLDNSLLVDGIRKSKGFFLFIPFIGNKTEFKEIEFDSKGGS